MNRPNNHMPQQLIKPWITICNFSLHFIIIKTDVPKIIGMREMPVKMILLPFGSDDLFGENWFSARAKHAACSGLFSTLMNKIDRMGKVPMIFPDVTQSSWPNVYASLDSYGDHLKSERKVHFQWDLNLHWSHLVVLRSF